MSQTDDDWNAALGEESTDDILRETVQHSKSVEYRSPVPLILSAKSKNPASEPLGAPSYPTLRRKGPNGLKPQYEGLLKGEQR